MAGNKNSGFASRKENINRAGRPKAGETLTDALREYATKADVDFNGGKITRKQALSQKLWQMALQGDLVAIKYIFDRMDGRPVETLKQEIHEVNDVHNMIAELVYGTKSNTE